MTACQLCDRALYGDHAEHYLCPGCTRATSSRLDRIPKLHRALAAFLTPTPRRPEQIATHTAEAPLPVREPVLDLRGPGGIVGVLEDWRNALHHDLGWTPPTARGTIEDRVTAAARGLRDNTLWIATSWPPAGDLAREIRDLEATAISVVNPPEKTLRLGHCTTPGADGTRCGAVLRAPAGTTDVRCPWCRTHYPPETWLALRANQPQPEGAPS